VDWRTAALLDSGRHERPGPRPRDLDLLSLDAYRSRLPGVALILVTVRENEPFEKALRRFRRKVEREGIRKDIKKNSFYLKPGEKKRLKQRLAEKRRRKAMRRALKKPR
jgi:small subunit ribosomal protein S21